VLDLGLRVENNPLAGDLPVPTVTNPVLVVAATEL
jgi:hypothetical protein